MSHYGMSDYASYWESFCDEDKVNAFNKKYATDVENKLLAYLSEVSYDVFGPNRREVFVGRMNDPSAVIKFMDRLASKTGVKASKTCQGYVLSDLGKNSFVSDVFGEEFKSIKRCCYAIVDQYLVMASNFETIQEIISCYRSGRTLDLHESFRAFQQRMLESSNITLYHEHAQQTGGTPGRGGHLRPHDKSPAKACAETGNEQRFSQRQHHAVYERFPDAQHANGKRT